MKITAADYVRIDHRTDVREVIEPINARNLPALDQMILSGQLVATPGLIGWGHTHTLMGPECPDFNFGFHATFAEETR